MLARAVPGAAVLVCEQRAMARALAERALGATVHVLDDGFQHASARARRRYRHRRAGRPARSPRCRSAGCGSPVSRARARARRHRRRRDGDARARRRAGRREHRRSSRCSAADRRSRGRSSRTEPLAGHGRRRRRARRHRRARALHATRSTRAGWNVARAVAFPRSSSVPTGAISRASRPRCASSGAAGVLTTEKDAVRLLPLRPLPVPIAVVPLEVDGRAGGGVPRLAARRDVREPARDASRGFRHRRRVRARVAVRALVGRAARAAVARPRHGDRLAVLSRRRRPSASGRRAARARRFPADRQPSAARSRAQTFAHFGRLLVAVLRVQHAVPPTRFCARVDYRRRGARSRGARRAARASSSSRATSGSGSCRGSRTRSCCRRCPCWRARSTTPTCTICSSGCAARPATASSTARARMRRVLRALEANECVGDPDRPAHPRHRRRHGGLLQPAGGDDVRAGDARAAHGRAARAGASRCRCRGGRFRVIYEHPVELPPPGRPIRCAS